MENRKVEFVQEQVPENILSNYQKNNRRVVEGRPRRNDAPIEEISEINEIGREKNPLVVYAKLLDRHRELSKRVRTLAEKISGIGDEKAQSRLEDLDAQRHVLHLEILECAKVFNKNAADVEMDLLALEGSAREYGIDIPIIKFDRQYDTSTYDLIVRKRDPEFIKIVNEARRLVGKKGLSRGEMEGPLHDFEEMLYTYLERCGVFASERTEFSSTLRDFEDAFSSIKAHFSGKDSGEDIYTALEGIAAVISYDLQLHRFLFPDEVILLYGVHTSPEGYGPGGRAREQRSGTTTLTPVQELEWSRARERQRENLNVYSIGFAQRMTELGRMMEDEPLARGWASEDIINHGEHRLYGLAVRAVNLEKVFARIRDNKEKYWRELDTNEGEAYVVFNTRGRKGGYYGDRNARTGKKFKCYEVPEMLSVPGFLKDQHAVDSYFVDGKGLDEDEAASAAYDFRLSFQEKESDHIWKIMNP